jgi:hypothetical protein
MAREALKRFAGSTVCIWMTRVRAADDFNAAATTSLWLRLRVIGYLPIPNPALKLSSKCKTSMEKYPKARYSG